jgi:hypothetical protein
MIYFPYPLHHAMNAAAYQRTPHEINIDRAHMTVDRAVAHSPIRETLRELRRDGFKVRSTRIEPQPLSLIADEPGTKAGRRISIEKAGQVAVLQVVFDYHGGTMSYALNWGDHGADRHVAGALPEPALEGLAAWQSINSAAFEAHDRDHGSWKRLFGLR